MNFTVFCKTSVPFLGLTIIGWTPAVGQDSADIQTGEQYDYRERTRQIAFDPNQFFPENAGTDPFMSIVYSGDDYGYPVYSIAIREGCVSSDQGKERKPCDKTLIARMVRSPFNGEPGRAKERGMELFSHLYDANVSDDAELSKALSDYRLEWLEVEVHQCPSAIQHLQSAMTLRFFASPPYPDTSASSPSVIILHADKITFEVGEYLERSRYHGAIFPDTPGQWAHELAKALEPCWKPADAPQPWTTIDKG